MRLQLRYVPADKLIYSTGQGPDREVGAERLRRQAERKGYTVEPEYAIMNANPKIRGIVKS